MRQEAVDVRQVALEALLAAGAAAKEAARIISLDAAAASEAMAAKVSIPSCATGFTDFLLRSNPMLDVNVFEVFVTLKPEPYFCVQNAIVLPDKP